MKALTRHPLFHDPAYPSCERLDDAQRQRIAEFNKGAAAGSIQFHEAKACLCGGHEFETVATYDRYRLWQPVVLCKSCGLLFCNPRMADDTLGWFYGSDLYRHLYNSKQVLPHTRDMFLKQAAESSRRRDSVRRIGDYERIKTVGEIGCAAGWNLWSFHQDGKRVTGTDYSPELTEAGREMGMDIRTGPMNTIAAEKFDALLISHVLEHLPDPLEALKTAASMLEPEGLLYVEVPDGRYICLGLFQNAHLWYFTPTRLRHLAAQAGLVPVAEESYGGIHFSLTFRRQDNPPLPDLSGEYALMRSLIRRFEKRERVKDLLGGLGLLGLSRTLLGLIRR